MNAPTEHIVFQIGAFVLDTDEGTLWQGENVIAAEPKVIELLHYFCLHPDRLITTSELHEQVWHGRVVSDAAVRRAISKLRHLLAENEDHDSCIKSFHKKSYKLQLNVSLLGAAPVFKSGRVSHHQQPYAMTLTKSYGVYFLLILLLGALAGTVFTNYSETTLEVVRAFPGEKVHVAVARDNKTLAYAGKVIGLQGYQLFISRDRQHASQLTSYDNNVIRVEFSHDEKSLYYLDLSIGNSQIKKRSTEPEESEASEIILQGYYLISDFVLAVRTSGVYFTAMKEKGNTSQVYYLDFDKGDVTDFTSVNQSGNHDYRLALSQSGDFLAVVTAMENLTEQKITLFDLTTRRVVKRIFHEESLYAMEWLSEESLLLLDQANLSRLSVSEGTKALLLSDLKGSVRSMDVTADNTVVLLKDGASDSVYVEMSLETLEPGRQRGLSHEGGEVKQLLFYGDSRLLKVKKNGELYQVTLLDQSDRETELLTTSISTIVWDSVEKHNLLLLELDGLFATLNTQTNELKYITHGGQTVMADGVFSLDGQGVYYAEKTADNWRVMEYRLETGVTKVLFDGYQSVRESESGYFLVDKHDRLNWQGKSRNEPEVSAYEISPDVNTRWFVRQNKVIWSTFDGRYTRFQWWDHDTLLFKSKKFSSSQVDSRFDVNGSGDKLLLKSQKLPDTDIVEFKY